ncbi:hydrogenase maturation nickel metallochaperone HypA, partial [Candidatus Woesearchaeota archaeon]|nr:hydrogenase maturation nickel metallochaperone HypA [Candidatus Woesearchaeota archaeon]
MHELSVTKNLIGLVVEECSSNGIKQPSKIIVELGELTNYKKDPIIFYFDIMKKETPCLVNAELEVIETKGKIRCRDCYKESHIKENYL